MLIVSRPFLDRPEDGPLGSAAELKASGYLSDDELEQVVEPMVG